MIKFNNTLGKLLAIFFLLTLNHCSTSKKDPISGEEVLKETNIREKASKYEGSLFGNITKDKSNNNFDFATSNPLWRATLQTINFMPINNVDYSGGVIVTDWYSEDLNSKETIKIFINFSSNELRASSLNIIAHKKTCLTPDNCKIAIMDNNFTSNIKEKIISVARKIKIEEVKKKDK
jgi:hypothetical protein